MSYTSKAKGTRKLKRLRGKTMKKLSKQSQLWKSRLKPKATRRKPIVKMTKDELKKYNKTLRIDDKTNRHQMLGAVIALSLLAFTFVPIVPESYVTNLKLPGDTVEYPNAKDNNNPKLPNYTVDSSAADYEDGLIIDILDSKTFPYRAIDEVKEEVKEIENKTKVVVNNKIKEITTITPKKVKRFAFFQIVKLMLGIPIIPGS